MRQIVYITDEGYLLPTKVSIASIVRNVRDVELAIHVIAVDLPEAKGLALQAIGNANIQIRIHNLPPFPNEPGERHSYVSAAAFLKARIQYILPDVDSVLYIDGDTIIYPGAMDIFNTDISDVYAAVVMDMCVMRQDKWYSEFGLSRYFNSGVMYLNLKKMREDHIDESFDVLFRRDDIPKTYYEQHPLNAAFDEHVIFLSLRYNFFSLYRTRFTKEEVLEFFGAQDGDYDSPAILHLAGSAKPWRTPAASGADIWLQYVSPEDALTVAKNYCDSIREGFSRELAKQARALSAVETQADAMRGQFRIQAVLGANLISESTNGVLLSGFEREEKWGRWTTGNASIRVWSDDFLHTGGDLLLYARLRSFNMERRVSFFMNGQSIHEMTLPVESTKITVKIAKSLLRSDNLLEIRTDPVGTSPAELGTGTDTRNLCLGIEYIRLADNIHGALAALGESDRQNRTSLAKLSDSDRRTQAALTALGEADRRTQATLAALGEADRRTQTALAALGEADRRTQTALTSALAKHKDEISKERADLLAALGNVDQQNKAAIAEIREENSRDRAEFVSLKDACSQDWAALAALSGNFVALGAELGQLRNENAILADRLAFLSGNFFIRTFLWISEMKQRLLSLGRKRAKGE